jgi:4-hydroxybenzoate polyprenyltransferase|tara:strand:- start:11 stop:217 length:207 start_codon:yes stop_codon:yes gene_type:complete
VNISATLIGQIIFILIPVFAAISYYLGKRKTSTPIVVAVIGGLLGLIPLFGLIFIAVLALKKDIETTA